MKREKMDLDLLVEMAGKFSVYEIAERLERAPNTIRYYARELGISLWHVNRKWKSSEITRMKKMHEYGKSWVEIAKIMGSTREKCLKACNYGKYKRNRLQSENHSA